MVGLFVIVWAIVAYLALPRFHRILSSLYVPNYFIGRTRTSDGLLGDPVNLALRGSEAQLHAAMVSAGWALADEITPRSAWRMIVAILTRRSYKNAPVSPLFLFGRRQDFTYQQEIDGNPGKRHHVRFWRCPQGWLLPGGHQVDWLAAGTYDKSVGLSLFTLQITHKIDENTDIERDYVVKTVVDALPHVKVTNLKDFSTGYHSRNGGGDTIQTDGDLPVLELETVQASKMEASSPGVILDATGYRMIPKGHDTLIWQLWNRRPPQISFGVLLVILMIMVMVVSVVVDFINIENMRQQAAIELQKEQLSVDEYEAAINFMIGASVGVLLIWTVLVIFLTSRTFRGSDRSRLMLMVMSSGAALVSSFSLTVGRVTWSTFGLLFFIGLNIAVILLLSSDAARRFTMACSQRG